MLRTAKSCGPGTRCWCQVRGGRFGPTGLEEPLIRGRRWQKEFVTGESAKETVKTIAQGRPDDSAYTCGLYPCAFLLHRGPRVRWAPGLPCALCFFWRDDADANLGRIAPRERGHMLSIEARSLGAANGSRGCAPDDRLGDEAMYCFLALFFSRATMIGALLWEDVLRSPLHSDRAGGFSLYNPRCS